MDKPNLTILKTTPAPQKRADISSDLAQAFSKMLGELPEQFNDGRILQIGIVVHTINENEQEQTLKSYFGDSSENPVVLLGMLTSLITTISNKMDKDNGINPEST